MNGNDLVTNKNTKYSVICALIKLIIQKKLEKGPSQKAFRDRTGSYANASFNDRMNSFLENKKKKINELQIKNDEDIN